MAEGDLDLGPAIADRSNVLLMGQHGGVLFHCHQPGIYEAHTQVLPEGRGEWCVNMVRAALHWMFTRSDAMEILTRCPKGNLGARALAKAIGGRFEFINPNGWAFNRKIIPADIFALRLQDWMRQAPGLEERGKWFLNLLDREYSRLGFPPRSINPLSEHLRQIGYACEAILGGQPGKGVVLYNRFAALADYARIAIASIDPLAINVQSALVVVRDSGEMYVATIDEATATQH